MRVVEFLERLPSRQLQIAIIGDFALTWWIDDADRHVKILDIHAADG